MSLVRRRYYTWLIRAYFRRWSKTIISSLIIGVIAFFILIFTLNFYLFPLLEGKVQKVGYWGSYTAKSIPHEILSNISYGLTRVNNDGTVAPGAAFKWEIKNGGLEYIFYIKKGQYFHGKEELTAYTLPMNFKDVKKKIIDDYTVSLTLKEPYSPFLTTVSRPIFNEGFSGLGEFKVGKMDLNASFIKSIALMNKNDRSVKKIISFYPTQEALKTAFSLGEIDMAIGVADLKLKNSSIDNWSKIRIDRRVNYNQLVTTFYNNADSLLSSKKTRQALSFAIPQNFSEGERTYSPISPRSIYFSKPPNYGISDLDIARDIINSEKDVKGKILEISTNQEYKAVAQKIARDWAKIGVKAKIRIVSGIPEKFQILIYPIRIPQDPDQYTLWHSGQPNNIIKYKNLRIDKLLEDGREITDKDRRINIYSDFQKYLIDDAPASFLYFPYEYVLIRK